MRKWCAPGELVCTLAEADVRVGGAFRIHMSAPGPSGETHKAFGSYREVNAPARLVYTWAWEGSPDGETLVTVDFKEKGAGVTEVIMVHELPTEESKTQHEQGWMGCFEKFEKLFA